MVETLSIAVCICDEVTLADFILPMEILGGLNISDIPAMAPLLGEMPYRVKMDYLAPSMRPVCSLTPGLVTVNPTITYAEAIEKGIRYDIIWVPAGPLPNLATGEDATPKDELEFIRYAAPNAKYVMSVCAGSYILAMAGVLKGKRATTNKSLFKAIVSFTQEQNITWIPHARWVVEGNTWTSSGVSAGGDMALAFLEHLAGKKAADIIRGIVEVPQVESSEDDPFAAVHGLV